MINWNQDIHKFVTVDSSGSILKVGTLAYCKDAWGQISLEGELVIVKYGSHLYQFRVDNITSIIIDGVDIDLTILKGANYKSSERFNGGY